MKKIGILCLLLCLLLPCALVTADSDEPAAYAAAEQLEEEGKLEEALERFTALGDYADSAACVARVQEKIYARDYEKAMQYVAEGNFSAALELFTALGDYEDSAEKAYTLGVIRFARMDNRGNGVAAYCFHDAWGVIDLQLNTVSLPLYSSIGAFDEYGLANVVRDSKYGCIDTSGHEILPCEYEEIAAFTDGLAMVKKNGKYGYVNTQGQTVIACEWARVSEFYDGVCTVLNWQSANCCLFGLYRTDGTPLTEAVWRTLGDSYNSNWGKSGNTAYYSAPFFTDGFIKAQSVEGLWGYIKRDGSVAVEIVYEALGDYAYDLCPAKTEGLWGFIDREGNMAVLPLYSEVRSFTAYGYAEVLLPGSGWQVIGREGSLLYFVNEKYIADYEKAVRLMEEERYKEAYALFITLEGHADSHARAAQCLERMYEQDYQAAQKAFEEGSYEEALAGFEALGDYKKSAALAEECREAIKVRDYAAAKALFEEGRYEEAGQAFAALGQYSDSAEMTVECAYRAAAAMLEAGEYAEAKAAFTALGDYKDSKTMTVECDYRAAAALYDAGKYEEALAGFEALGGYKDSTARAQACREAIREQTYQTAVSLMNKGRYGEALELFEGIRGYKNTDTLLTENEGLQEAAWSPGHYVVFGAYEQDNNINNGKEPIEWLVLEKTGDTVLLISRYALDAKPYHNQERDVTWEQCSLRNWLNRDFLNAAFSREEQARLETVDVDNGSAQSPGVSTNGGRNTRDKVYLLSCAEVGKYFTGNSDRICMATAYAKNNGAYTNGAGACWWWLRSPGSNLNIAAYVINFGLVYGSGGRVDNTGGCARPVVRVRL